MVIVRLGSVQGYEFFIVAFRSAKGRVLRRICYGNPTRTGLLILSIWHQNFAEFPLAPASAEALAGFQIFRVSRPRLAIATHIGNRFGP